MSLAFELLASGLAANPIVSQFHVGVKGHPPERDVDRR